MRIKRLLVGALGSALVLSTPLALSTNAQAATDKSDSASAVAESSKSGSLGDGVDTEYTASGSQARTARATTSRLKMDRQRYSVYRFKQYTRISGQIQASGDGCSATWCYVNLSGDAVRLYRRIAGTSKLRYLGIRYGNSTGRFVFNVRSLGTAEYVIRYSGVGAIPAAGSRKVIRGSRNPGVRVFTSRGRVYMKGNVDPGYGFNRVSIMRKTSKYGSFRVYARPRTNKYGVFQLRLPAPRSGFWYYRAVVPKNSARFAAAKSGVWRTYQR